MRFDGAKQRGPSVSWYAPTILEPSFASARGRRSAARTLARGAPNGADQVVQRHGLYQEAIGAERRQHVPLFGAAGRAHDDDRYLLALARERSSAVTPMPSISGI